MIQTVTFRAQSMLLDAMIKWPEMVTTELWPYAIKMSVDILNNCPFGNRLSPLEQFSEVKSRARVKQFHTFRLPVFVLDPRLCLGNKIPKWNLRSQMGVYLGISPQHAGSVSLVYSPLTGYISS